MRKRKTTMKKILLLLLIAILPFTTYAQSTKIRIATVIPEGSSWIKCMRNIGDEVQRLMNIQFIIYAGGTAGEANAILEKIKYGQLDGGGFMGSTISELSPKLRILDLPYKYKNLEEWKYVFKKIRREATKDLEKNNFIALGWSYGGFVDLYSKQPIRTLQDLQDAKVWFSPSDPLMDAFFRKLKIHGVPLSTTNIYPSLQTGLLNCVYNTPYGIMAMQWHTQVQYKTNYPIVNTMGTVIITKKAFESIPSQYRRLFLTICTKHFNKLAEEIEKQNQQAEQDLATRFNIQTIQPDQEWLKETEKISNEIAQEGIGKLYTKELYEEVETYLKEIRKK